MNERLTTHDLAEFLANQTGLSIAMAQKFIGEFSSYISQGIARNKAVNILGFGKFKIVLVRERESVHIQTGERFIIPAHHKLSFVPDKAFKEQINRPFAFFATIEATESHSLKKVTFNRDVESDKKVINTPDDNIIPDPVVDKVEDDNVTGEVNVTNEVAEASVISDSSTISSFEELPIEELPIIEENPSTSKKITYDDYFGQEYEELLKKQASVGDSESDFVETYSADEIKDYVSELAVEEETVENVTGDNGVIAENDEDIAEKGVEYIDGSLEGVNVKSEESEDVDKENIKNANERKKKKVPFWLLFISLLFVVGAGSGIATYAFLHYNYDKKTTSEQSYVTTEQGLTIGDEASLPTGLFPIPEIDSNEVILEGVVDNLLQNNETMIGESDPEATDSNKKEENRPINNWLVSASENSSSGTRRADRPNMEIENRNRELARTAQTNRNQPSSGNTTSTNQTATNNTARSTTPPENKEKIIPKSVHLAAGSTLMQIALEYYGDKVFWVYLYDYNKDRIKDYNNIPVGTEIMMPLPSRYGINAKIKSSVDKARERQSQLYK